jgi:hypothetical protein
MSFLRGGPYLLDSSVVAMASSSKTLAIMEHQRGAFVDQTKLGLLLLTVGILLSAVPFIRPAGVLVALTGAILSFLGREYFGEKHSKSVHVAAAIFGVGMGLVLIASIWYSLFFLSTPLSPYATFSNTQIALWQGIVPYLTLFFAIEAAGTMMTGIAFALFIFYLTDQRGRRLTLIAAVTSVAISVLVFSLLNSAATTPLISGDSSLVYTYAHGYSLPTAWTFEDQFLMIGLLNLVPAIIYAVVYRSVYSHLK